MHTPASGNLYEEIDVFVYGTSLEVVKVFVYLGNILSNDGSLDAEIKPNKQNIGVLWQARR